MTQNRRGLMLAALALSLIATPVLAQERPRDRPRGRLRERLGARRDPQDGASDADKTTVSTGADPLQAYDLYRPTTPGGPILAFVHGGGWSRGDKRMVHALPDYAVRHGLTLASIGYRLVPDVTPREQAQDIVAAVADLRRTHPGQPIFLMGHSAGAHLAALVGVDGQYLGVHDIRPADLGGVILLDGAGYDATQPRPPGPVGRILGDMYETAFADQAAALSPTLLVRSGQTYAPYLIFHIGRRQDARDQSQELARALIAAGGRAEVIAAPDDSHRDINVQLGQPGDPEGERVARFITGLGYA